MCLAALRHGSVVGRGAAFAVLVAAAAWIALELRPRAAAALQDPHGGGRAEAADCVRCHKPIADLIGKSVPHKPAAEGQCTGCHSPHAARFENLLNLRERALCATCHKDKIAGFLQGHVHTPVQQGQCSGCHEVHGSDNAGLLSSAGNELCTKCHVELQQRASWPSVHDPFVNGACTDCHAAHNSPNANQLIAPVQQLCQACHQPDADTLVQAHAGIPIKGTSCVSCHDPHASTTKKLLRQVTHAPFADGSCEMCHMTETATPQVVRATGGKLCATCHQDYPKKGDAFVHQPVAQRDCNACHLSHAGDIDGLLVAEPKDLCTSCHKDLVARASQSKSAHPVDAKQGACLACHSAHSSSEPSMLISGPIRTCLGCHETASHGHPLGEGRLDPRDGKPITCVTCHDPHGTQFSYELRGDQSRGLCVDCHDPEKHGGKGGGK
jgi:predicted CXXCH cytochrome family protein